jgi:two-component system, sensor histidine kinase and response regulator
MKSKPRILIVDDEKSIANMLQKALGASGYEAEVVYRGEDALRRVRESPPDLILLDVMMPEMDGYEVCRALKGDAKTAIIPIIMTTALTDRKERHEGMAAGADDYLTKPIDSVDLVLRVGNAVRMKALYDDLQHSYAQLRDLEALRDHLVHLIVHDMRTPLQGILGYLQLLEARADSKGREYLRQAQESGAILTRLTEDLLSVHQMQSGQIELRPTPVALGEVWAEARSALAAMATMQDVELVESIPEDCAPLQVDRDLIRRVLLNLVGNALKYAPRGGRIEIRVEEVARLARKPAGNGAAERAEACSPPPGDGAAAEPAGEAAAPSWTVVSVQDNGPGILPEYHEKIFEKFGVVEAMQVGSRRSTGLGLTFCKLAVEAHGGRIGVESDKDQGCTFWFALPRV